MQKELPNPWMEGRQLAHQRANGNIPFGFGKHGCNVVSIMYDILVTGYGQA